MTPDRAISPDWILWVGLAVFAAAIGYAAPEVGRSFESTTARTLTVIRVPTQHAAPLSNDPRPRSPALYTPYSGSPARPSGISFAFLHISSGKP